MFSTIILETFAGVLAPYATCFQARSALTFQWLVLGWVQCLERRTLTAVALASGAVGARHISVFHRFFARAQWSLDAVGQVVFEQALRWLPADQPVYLLGDDTLARKSGKCVSLASMHHDPLLSTARKPFFSFGHVWVVLALWVPLPMGRGRGFALPLLVRLYTGAKRGGRAEAPSRPTTGQRRRVAETAHATRDRRTKLELLREQVGLGAPPATRPTCSRSTSSLVRRSRVAWAVSATRRRCPVVGRDGASARPPRFAPVYRRTSSGKANPRPRPIGRGTHSASTTHTCPKLKNGLRAVESNGSWCIDARLTHLPLLRASVSSPSKYTGWSAGSHRSACWKTTCPRASRRHCARAKKR